MAWTIRFDPRFALDLRALDKSVQRRIVSYLENRVATANDPRALGHSLSYDLAGHWRYRIGDYRVICRFHDSELIVIAVAVGHRSKVYEARNVTH